MNFSKRVALLVTGKTVPRNEAETILMQAYQAAMEGQSLVKAYLTVDENKLVGDTLHCFVLGFSAGQATRKFTLEHREVTSNLN